MDEPPSRQYRSRRLAILCGAALAAAVFTPVPATAFAAVQPLRQAAPIASVQTGSVKPPDKLSDALISTGMAGLGLAMSGLVIVALRRRQY